MLQIFVGELHNNLILPVDQGVFSGAWDDKGRVYIGDTSLRKYILKHINTRSNINIITCGCETYTGTMLLQYDLNK